MIQTSHPAPQSGAPDQSLRPVPTNLCKAKLATLQRAVDTKTRQRKRDEMSLIRPTGRAAQCTVCQSPEPQSP